MDDEDPDKDDGGPTRGSLRRPLICILGYDDRDDDVASRHSDRPNGEDWFSTDTVNVEDCWDCRKKQEDPYNACS